VLQLTAQILNEYVVEEINPVIIFDVPDIDALVITTPLLHVGGGVFPT
jgi:hypothetical protein